MADFKYHVSDTLPPMDFTLQRRGSVVDLTALVGGTVYIRPAGGSANVMAGSGVVSVATAGSFRFIISGASLGSAGFSAPGTYLGQITLSWASGPETNKYDFSVEVERAYRIA